MIAAPAAAPVGSAGAGALHLEVDARLAAFVVATDDGRGALEHVAGPHLLAELHPEPADVLRAEPVGDVRREDPALEHPLREHRREAGVARELVVEVDRVEVTRRAGVAHEVGLRERAVLPGLGTEAFDERGRVGRAHDALPAALAARRRRPGGLDQRVPRLGDDDVALVAVLGDDFDEAHRAAAPTLLRVVGVDAHLTDRAACRPAAAGRGT